MTFTIAFNAALLLAPPVLLNVASPAIAHVDWKQ